MDSLEVLKTKREELTLELKVLVSEYHNAGRGIEKSRLISEIVQLRLELNEVQNIMIRVLEKWLVKTTLL